MTRTSHTSRLLLAVGLISGAVAAHAASGFNVTASQETLVHAGMDKTEVRRDLGRPEASHQFLNESGRTWTYQVIGTESRLFDVDFSADGKVVSSSERVVDLE